MFIAMAVAEAGELENIEAEPLESVAGSMPILVKGVPITKLLYMDQVTEDKSTVDLKIVCKNGKVFVHRHILMAASSYIKDILLDTDPNEMAVIHILDVTVEIIAKVLYVLYHGVTLYNKGDERHIYQAFQILGIETNSLQFRESKPEDTNLPRGLRFYKNDDKEVLVPDMVNEEQQTEAIVLEDAIQQTGETAMVSVSKQADKTIIVNVERKTDKNGRKTAKKGRVSLERKAKNGRVNMEQQTNETDKANIEQQTDDTGMVNVGQGADETDILNIEQIDERDIVNLDVLTETTIAIYKEISETGEIGGLSSSEDGDMPPDTKMLKAGDGSKIKRKKAKKPANKRKNHEKAKLTSAASSISTTPPTPLNQIVDANNVVQNSADPNLQLDLDEQEIILIDDESDDDGNAGGQRTANANCAANVSIPAAGEESLENEEIVESEEGSDTDDAHIPIVHTTPRPSTSASDPLHSPETNIDTAGRALVEIKSYDGALYYIYGFINDSPTDPKQRITKRIAIKSLIHPLNTKG